MGKLLEEGDGICRGHMTRRINQKWLVLASVFVLSILLTMCGEQGSSNSGCASYTPSLPDTTAPSVPANLRSEAIGSTAVSLAWDPSYDNGWIYYYEVYRNGVLITSTSQTKLFDAGLQLGVQYCYAVSSVDYSGNRSARSTALCLTTQTDVVAPSVPEHLSAASVALTESTLSWEPSTDNLIVAGYKVYRDGAYVQSVTTTWARDSNLTPNTKYCYTIAAYDLDGNLSPMSNTACVTPSSAWTISVIDNEWKSGWSASLAQDPSGGLHVGYLHCELYNGYYYCSLKYATNSSGQWVVSYVNINENASQNGASLAVDSTGKVHISYQSGPITTDNGLKYTTNASGQWAIVNLDQYGSHPSVGVDHVDKVHIAYYDYHNCQLKYATNASGMWSTTILDSWSQDACNAWSPVWVSPSLTLDSAAHVHISYYDSYNQCVKYAVNANGSWAISSVDSWNASGATIEAVASDIAVDSSGKVHISYYDYVNKNLRYVTNSSGNWAAVTIDSSPDVGISNSIAIDSTGKVYISYSDGTYGDLKYAVKASAGWQLYDLDNIESVGSYASMVVDPADNVHVCYFDYTNGYLKYITNK